RGRSLLCLAQPRAEDLARTVRHQRRCGAERDQPECVEEPVPNGLKSPLDGKVPKRPEIREEEDARDTANGRGPYVVPIANPGQTKQVVEDEVRRARRQTKEPDNLPPLHGDRLFHG